VQDPSSNIWTKKENGVRTRLFPTFLGHRHKPFSEPLQVQTNRSLTTKGSITSPRAKKHPTNLRPWHDFPNYNSNTSIVLIRYCVPMTPASQALFLAPEILSLKLRVQVAALAAGADFLSNFLVVEMTPVGLDYIGWRLYVIFAVPNAVNAMIVWCFYPETGGIKLESIDRLFIKDEASPAIAKGGRHFFRKLRWDVVPREAEYSR
jgi:hypothetical protein